jgi:transcriptional regulator with XRE-family HTH domain
MDAASTIRMARRSARLTLRELADRAETSHATIAAYEAGTKTPRVDTLDRIVRAAGFGTDIEFERRPDADRVRKGRELAAALDLASSFPARHAHRLRYPRLADVFQ